jgi:hypothetical protein
MGYALGTACVSVYMLQMGSRSRIAKEIRLEREPSCEMLHLIGHHKDPETLVIRPCQYMRVVAVIQNRGIKSFPKLF